MASPRYTLNIEKEDLVPEEEITLTRKEAVSNWFHYHKLHVALAVFLAALAIWLIHDVRTRILPDYQFALITPVYINEDLLSSMETALEAELEDVNKDGHVRVNIAFYQLDYSRNRTIANLDSTVQGNEDTMSAEMRISTDLSVSDSIIFITDDFESLQENVPIFSFLDSPYYYPAEEERDDYEKMYTLWGDSDLMNSLELVGNVYNAEGETVPAQEFFANFQIAMRTLYDDTDEELVTRFISCTDVMERIRGIEED